MTTPRFDLAADHIRELIRPFVTHEQVTQPVQGEDGRWRTQRRQHDVTHPALLDQIHQTVTGSTMGEQEFRAAYGSKPAGRLDALAYLHRLAEQSARMCTELDVVPDAAGLRRLVHDKRLTDRAAQLLVIKARLSALSGVIGDRPNRRVKAWWATARVLTQHDAPPFAPMAPCPTCDQWGTLRVRFDPKVAVCVECEETWDDQSPEAAHQFGRLAIWVEWSTEHLHGLRHWVGDDDVTGYPGLGYVVECPECAPERLERAKREAERMRRRREYAASARTPERVGA